MEEQRQTEVLKRLKITRGHLEKVIQMVEEGRYCIDILQQSLAVQSALREIDKIILKNHLLTCVARAMQGKKKEEVTEEIVALFEKARK